VRRRWMGAGVHCAGEEATERRWAGRSGDPPAIVDLTAIIGVNWTTTCPRPPIPAVGYEFASNSDANS
jgi:hypothetical protein